MAMLADWFATAVFTVNPELKKEIVRIGVDEKKVLLTQNGLFMNRINMVPDQERNRFDAVYMGRITENKGIFDLLSAWYKVVKTFPDAKLAIMGTGREDVVRKFKEQIKASDLEKNIEYLGYVCGDKKYEIFKSSKIFVFLSKVNADESWGISLMEALACGLPAVTYDLAIYEHVYKKGILLKNRIGNIEAVAREIIFLLSNQKERVDLSEKSAEFARQFNWRKIANDDLDKIKEIIEI